MTDDGARRRNGPGGPLLRRSDLLDLGLGPGALVELHQKVSHALMTPEGSADTREEWSPPGHCEEGVQNQLKHGFRDVN